MNIFVPGRICLFGEHTDWAGSYRRINGELEKGFTIIAGTNHGIYANVKPHPTRFIVHSVDNDGKPGETLDMPMDPEELLKLAEKGEYYSYAAGVAYQVATHYKVRGLEIDNYKTDLPIKKGLSSSAAICVLVARAFNRVYDLKMTIRGEMEFSYLGEITTPSRCGRMDQGCAYGNKPVLMTFDGDMAHVKELSVKEDMHFVIVDLHASKDTPVILNQLHHCYPFADTDEQKDVQKYLGPISKGLTQAAVIALESGDAEELGSLMTKAQAEFDKYLIPACPSQLTAPVLHKVLSYEPLKEYVYGGKGVGSQGDGTAQFVAKDAKSQKEAMELIEKDLGLSCISLVLHSGTRVRKAVIPAAGYGTRLFPATKVMKKELFPVIDSKGQIKPVILAIVEEALSAGIEEVCIVCQKEDKETFEDFFGSPPPIEHYNKLSREMKLYNDYLLDLGRKVTLISQEVQEGFGHAVHCTKDWVANEPFLLLLGDHLYSSSEKDSCAKQVLDVYNRLGQSVVGLMVTPGNEVHNFGCAGGTWTDRDSLISITEFAEKPDQEYAQEHLHIEGMGDDSFLSVFGQYVLQPSIFDHLEEHINHNVREKGEFQLTSCLDRIRQEEGFVGLIVKGRRFDVGLPESYRQALIDFRTA